MLFAEQKLSNRKIAKTLNISDKQIGRDLATNVAPGEKNSNQNKQAKLASATHVALRL